MAHPLRQGLLSSEPPQVGRVGVERRCQQVKYAQRPGDPEQVLQAGALTVLKSHDGIARNSGSLGYLRGRELSELAPGPQLLSDPALRAGDWNWCSRGGHTSPKVAYMKH